MEYSFSTAANFKPALLAATFLIIFSSNSAAQQTPAPPKPDPPAEAQPTAPRARPPESSSPVIAPAFQPLATQQIDKVKDGNTTTNSPKPTGKTSNDRLFFTFPNFLTLENADSVPPLTTGEKYKVVTRSSFDYVYVPLVWRAGGHRSG
jgi:hypothetical protein